MKNLIIALSGVYDSGKTSTIRLVRDKIVSDLGGKVLVGELPNEFHGKGDIKVVIEIEGFKIGIESQGDPTSRQKYSVTEFIKINCDIIITSCRSYGGTKDFIKSHNDTHEVIILDKYRTEQTQEDQDNEKYRDQIVEILQDYLRRKATKAA